MFLLYLQSYPILKKCTQRTVLSTALFLGLVELVLFAFLELFFHVLRAEPDALARVLHHALGLVFARVQTVHHVACGRVRHASQRVLVVLKGEFGLALEYAKKVSHPVLDLPPLSIPLTAESPTVRLSRFIALLSAWWFSLASLGRPSSTSTSARPRTVVDEKGALQSSPGLH